ncbi:MAG: hypothetical protein LBE25_02160 [Arthrobacter sp.]|jgi:hypothetical protein|nr:hypothetical protein [Arthrobacter sp.]
MHRSTLTLCTALAITAAAALSACNAFKDYSEQTCDARQPMTSFEEAGQQLVKATYAGDTGGACRALTAWAGAGKNYVTDELLERTKQVFEAADITAENVRVEEDTEAQAGSGHAVYLIGGGERVRLSGSSVWDAGFTLALPEGIEPATTTAPETGPPSSASVD